MFIVKSIVLVLTVAVFAWSASKVGESMGTELKYTLPFAVSLALLCCVNW